MGFGGAGYLAIARQDDFNTHSNSLMYVPFLNETLTTKIEQLTEQSLIHRNYDERVTRTGLLSVSGNIELEARTIVIGDFLRGCLGVSSVTNPVSGVVYKHLFLPTTQPTFGASEKVPVPPYTIQVFKDVGSSHQFTDAIINGLTFQFNAMQIMKVSASIVARVSSLSNPATGTISYFGERVFVTDQVSIRIAGGVSGDIETLTIDMNNSIEGVQTLNDTNLYSRFHRTDFRKFRVSGSMDFADQSEYNIFRSQAQQRFRVSMISNTTISSGYNEKIFFDMPVVRYASYEAPISGIGRVTAEFDGQCLHDAASGYALRVILTNGYADYGS